MRYRINSVFELSIDIFFKKMPVEPGAIDMVYGLQRALQ